MNPDPYMKRMCRNCRHLGEQYEEYHTCDRVRHDENLSYGGYRDPALDLAVVIDGSGYYAALLVADEFCCSLWEKADDAETITYR